jgi:hypothetical protein
MNATVTDSNWKTYAFEWRGFQFISRVDVTSPIGQKAGRISETGWQAMNIALLEEVIEGEWTRENLEKEIERINENGSEAFLELA